MRKLVILRPEPGATATYSVRSRRFGVVTAAVRDRANEWDLPAGRFEGS